MKLDELNIYNIGTTIGLVGAVFGDDKNTYLCLFPDQEIQDNQEVLDMDLEDWKKFLRQTDLVEVEVLQKTEHGKLAKSILRKTQRLVEQRVNWKVFKRDGYRCRYCGADDVPMTVDHLVLWEEGGPSIEGNLLTSCRKDNKTRGNMQYADWLKSPYYLKVSKNLSPAVRMDNESLVGRLADIPRNHTERKARK